MAQVEVPEFFETDEIPVSQFVEEHPDLKLPTPGGFINVTKCETPSAQDLLNLHRQRKFQEAYELTSYPRGRCLIISNRNFSVKRLRERKGTDVDRDRLQSLFQGLDYHVTVCNDCTADEILSKCHMFILDSEFKRFDSCVVCVLSHGSEQGIYGTDGKSVTQDLILRLFNDSECKLRGKPKLVIFQACRTKMKKSLVNYLICGNSIDCESDGGKVEDLSGIIKHLKESNLRGEEKFLEVVPKDTEDIIIANSTLPGRLSWRNDDEGSWFIQALVLVFNGRKENEHVADMLLLVKTAVEKAFNGVQVPNIANNLSKKFYFFPNAR